eukprot:6169864-Prymnesium_polylepis.1
MDHEKGNLWADLRIQIGIRKLYTAIDHFDIVPVVACQICGPSLLPLTAVVHPVVLVPCHILVRFIKRLEVCYGEVRCPDGIKQRKEVDLRSGQCREWLEVFNGMRNERDECKQGMLPDNLYYTPANHAAPIVADQDDPAETLGLCVLHKLSD